MPFWIKGTMTRSILLILSALLLSQSGLAVTAVDPAIPSGPVPGRFVVKLSANADPTLIGQSLNKDDSFRKASQLVLRDELIGRSGWDRFYVYNAADKAASSADIKNILGKKNVEYVEQDYYLEFFDYPTDHLFPNQWYLHNTGQEYFGIERVAGAFNDQLVMKSGTDGADIKLASIYENPPAETTRVVVAIVDTGIDPFHPELVDRIWHNRDEIPWDGIDNDHNGFIDDTLGYDLSGDSISFLNPVGDNDPTDVHGHGTHIAGIIASSADGVGIVGVAPFAEIMAVKIRPNATNLVAAAGIMYAVNSGAQAINISWGSPFESGVLKEAIDFARTNGVFVAIAPGNTGDNTRFFPAAFDSTFVVSAGNSSGYQTDFSTYGAHIDIVAPGLDILSLRAAGTDMYGATLVPEPEVRIIDDLYYLADGTSMATPVVVGAAALLLSFRPDLSLDELEQILKYGADDLIDPRNQGDSLPGPDTICGYGYLNIEASLNLMQNGGLYIVGPERRRRYIADIPIKIAPVAGYSDGWKLQYSIGLGSDNWLDLAQGTSLPSDSIAYLFTMADPDGFINLRLIDDYGSVSYTNFVYVRHSLTEITSPGDGQETKYSVAINGSSYGPDYDSMAIFQSRPGAQPYLLFSTASEFFDTLLYVWTLAGADTGQFLIEVRGYYQSGVVADSVLINVRSAFAEGWPRSLGGRGGITPVLADLDGDGMKELVVGTQEGLYMYHADGTLADGFPLKLGENMLCVPAIYDVDRDGDLELICTNADGLHVFNYDGSYAEGWPQPCYTGLIPYGYGYPNPTVTQLGQGEDSAIVLINKRGEILAFEFNGDPYFYSLGGLFASFDARMPTSGGSYGGTPPFVTSADLTGDGLYEVIASLTSWSPYTGMGIFDGRTGRAAFGRLDPVVVTSRLVFGTVLADLTGDGLPEVITAGRDASIENGPDSAYFPTIWVKTNGIDDLPGWPVALPEVETWIASYPIAADLDLDGTPEILITFFEFDIASLYIFRADGTPYKSVPGRPYGEAFHDLVTFGTPAVANLTGDLYPEIILRSGYLLPGTGSEKIYILDYGAEPLPGWPVATPARPTLVFSSRFAPLIDDLDGDGLVELITCADGGNLLVWDFDASSEDGANRGRWLMDNLNSGQYCDLRIVTDANGESAPQLPLRVSLLQNYPNPFNPATTISFTVPSKMMVTLEVFNILGRKVAKPFDGEAAPGRHQALFDGSKLASGIYFYRLRTEASTMTRKMVMIK